MRIANPGGTVILWDASSAGGRASDVDATAIVGVDGIDVAFVSVGAINVGNGVGVVGIVVGFD